MERKAFEKKSKIFVYLMAGLFVLLVCRLAYMQVLEVDRYRTLATRNHQRLIPVEAPRGEILDRNGVRIVSNKPVYTVSLVYLGLKDNESVINKLAELLSLEASFKGQTANQIKEDIQKKSKNHPRLYEPVKVAVNVSQQTVNRIEEQRLELPGVSIDVEPVRDYPFKDLMGEVLGYVREISADELENQQKKIDSGELSDNSHQYNMGDVIGQDGLEKSYEDQLRGQKGARLVEVDAQARPVRDLGIKEPTPGNNLVMTVDYRLQKVAQDAVASALAKSKPPPGKIPSGAAVVEDLRTGKILAMVTLPSYDLNVWSGDITVAQYNALASSGALRNHAIQSIFAPGSTFKMTTSTALLEKHMLTPDTYINDPGYYKTKLDDKLGGHGRVNIIRAIQVSCDTFFYIFGDKIGPGPMGHFASEYGLGQLTGIDLPNEEAGRVASPELKKKLWKNNAWESQWHWYDSSDMAIGQQETKVTAMQLANYVSTIANKGTLYRPYLVDKVVSPDGSVLLQNSPEVVRKTDVSQNTFNLLAEGMHDVTMGDGTATVVFAGAPYSAGAKTGTAEVGEGTKKAASTSLFVAFAPYEKPEVAVSVIIEHGGYGATVAGPVARQIFDTYFNLNKIPVPGSDEENNTGEPGAGAPAGAVQTPGVEKSQSKQSGGPAVPRSPGNVQPQGSQPGAVPGASQTTGGTAPRGEQSGQAGVVVPPSTSPPSPGQNTGNTGNTGPPGNAGGGQAADGEKGTGTPSGSTGQKPQGSPSG